MLNQAKALARNFRDSSQKFEKQVAQLQVIIRKKSNRNGKIMFSYFVQKECILAKF